MESNPHPLFPDNEYNSEYAILVKIDKLTPWEELEKLLEPAYRSNSSERPATEERAPINLILLIKIYVFQHVMDFSDEKMRFLVSDSFTLRRLLRLDPFARVPLHETSVGDFRLWVEREDYAEKIFEFVHKNVSSDRALQRRLKSIRKNFKE